MASSASKVTSLNKREFKEKIFNYTQSREWDYKGDMPAVIDFYADWCKPCKVVSPMLDQLSLEYEDRVKFYKINTEKDPEISKVFGISSIPTLLFIAPTGNPTVVRGAHPISALKRNIEKILPGTREDESILKRFFSFSRHK